LLHAIIDTALSRPDHRATCRNDAVLGAAGEF
jgi:hypothetical protein